MSGHGTERSTTEDVQGDTDALVRIDPTTFEALSSERRRLRIVRWLDCWSG